MYLNKLGPHYFVYISQLFKHIHRKLLQSAFRKYLKKELLIVRIRLL